MDESESIIIYGGPLEFIDNNVQCLGEMLLKRLIELDQSVILVNAITGEKLTAAKLYAETIRLAKSLQFLGIKSASQIGICCENCFDYVYVVMASIVLGATLTPMNIDYTDDELIAAISLSKPQIIFCNSHRIDSITKICQNYTFVKMIVDFKNDFEQQHNNKIVGYRNLIKSTVHISENRNSIQLNNIDMSTNVALILRTSGTTSCPKSIQMTQMNLLCTISEYSKKNLTPKPLVFTALPWVRAFGIRLLLRHIYHNVPTIFLPQFNKINFLQSIEKFQPNTVYLYVTTLEFLASDPAIDDYQLKSIKILCTSSAPLTRHVKEAVHRRLDIPMIIQGYGMSELSSIADQTDSHHKLGSVGTLRDGIRGKVIDIMTGIALGPNQRGELMFTGPNLMLGYLGNDGANAQALTADRWFHTGDYGYYDMDGEWFLVDRIKDLIRFRTEIIAPAEVEHILLDHGGVKDAAVIGIPDDQLGEIPFAFVECVDEKLTTDEIMSYFMSKTKLQLCGIRQIKKIPKDPAGKPSKVILRNLFNNTKG